MFSLAPGAMGSLPALALAVADKPPLAPCGGLPGKTVGSEQGSTEASLYEVRRVPWAACLPLCPSSGGQAATGTPRGENLNQHTSLVLIEDFGAGVPSHGPP